MATDNISSAGAITAFGIVTGVAINLALVIMASKYSKKQVSTGSLIMAVSLVSLASLVSIGLLKEAKT